MSAAPPKAADAEPADAKKAKGGKRKLILLAVPLLLAAIGAGLWFTGILPHLLGMDPKPPPAAAAAEKALAEAPPPVFVEMPEMIANLNAGARKTSYVKLRARIEVAKQEEVAAVQAAMPRLQDLFQTYLREMRPEELRGSIGTWRLREELIARASLAVAPVKVIDVLFIELLIQ